MTAILILKKQHDNEFHHGWLARHFGLEPRISDRSEAWREGYDTASESSEVGRAMILTTLLDLIERGTG